MTCPLTLVSRGGTSLQPAGLEYTSELVGDQLWLYIAGREVQTAEQAGRGSAYGGATWSPKEFQVQHTIKNGGAVGDATHEASLKKLRREHYRPDLGASTLIVTINSVNMRLTVGPPRLEILQDYAREKVRSTWTLLDMVRVDDNATTNAVAAAAKTSSPATLAVTNDGDAPATQVTVTLDPTAAKTAANGQRFTRYITPIWRSKYAARDWPVDITDAVGGAGWDHATEVTGGGTPRSLSSGNDVEDYVNGMKQDRWSWASGTGGWNAATTRIWQNLTFPPGRYWTLAAAIVAGTTALVMKEDLDVMPSEVPFVIGFEDTGYDFCLVTAVDRATRTLTVVRGHRGRAAASHAAGVKAWFCPVLIDHVWGWTGASAPVQDDTRKPMILEGSPPGTLSDNDYAHYQYFQETRSAGATQDRYGRAGAWVTEAKGAYDREKKTGQGDQYWRYVPHTTTITTDAAVATLMALSYNADGATSGHPLMDRWVLRFPYGATSITYTYVATTIEDGIATTPKEARLDVRGIDADGNELVLAKHDATSGTNTVTPAAPIYALIFAIRPYDVKTDENLASAYPWEPAAGDGFTIDDVKITFGAGDTPLILWDDTGPGATPNLYQFGRPEPGAAATLADSDGNTLSMHGTLVRLSETLTLDLDALTATVDDTTSRAQTMDGTFPTIPPGTNNLTFTDAGLSGGASVSIGVPSIRSTYS